MFLFYLFGKSRQNFRHTVYPVGLSEIIIVKIKDYRNDFWIVWGNPFYSMFNHTKYHGSAKRLSQNFRDQINVDCILMNEQRIDTNLKLYWMLLV